MIRVGGNGWNDKGCAHAGWTTDGEELRVAENYAWHDCVLFSHLPSPTKRLSKLRACLRPQAANTTHTDGARGGSATADGRVLPSLSGARTSIFFFDGEASLSMALLRNKIARYLQILQRVGGLSVLLCPEGDLEAMRLQEQTNNPDSDARGFREN